MYKYYIIGAIILLLLSSTLYYKLKANHYSEELESIRVSYLLQKQSIKSAETQNDKIEKSTRSYAHQISQKSLPNDCQKSLQFIVEEMKK